MTSTAKKGLAVGLLGAAIVVTCASSWACSVPVFRYALERWNADLYEVTIFHQGELLAEQQALVDRLQSGGLGSDANIRLRIVDLDGEPDADPDEKMRALWESQQAPELPWLVVRSPATQVEVWSGKLMSSAVETLFDSPLRREIARRLLFGQTAVWVLLEGPTIISTERGKSTEEGTERDDQTRDDAAFVLLKQRLAEEQAQLKLPEIEEADIQNGLVDIDPDALKIEFTALRLSRDDPRERAFVQMLLATEDDLHDFQQPMAFPIFGRGRVLYALVGKGISDENIHAACAELTGPCTCQVKAQNLGADLLMSVDWARLVMLTADVEKPLPPLTGLAALGEPLKGESESESQGESQGESDNKGKGKGKGKQESERLPKVATDTSVVTHQMSIPTLSTEREPKGVLAGNLEAMESLSHTGKTGAHASETGAVETRSSPLMIGMLVLLGLGVIGIAGASLLIVRR